MEISVNRFDELPDVIEIEFGTVNGIARFNGEFFPGGGIDSRNLQALFDQIVDDFLERFVGIFLLNFFQALGDRRF